MKKLVTILFIAILFTSCKKDSKDPNESANTRVKSYEATMIPVKFGEESVSSAFVVERGKYNADGGLTQIEKRSAYKDDYLKTISYTYNNGKLSEERELGGFRTVYEYQQNVLSQLTVYSEDYTSKKQTFSYDGTGRKSEVREYNYIGSESLFLTDTYHYEGNSSKPDYITTKFASDDDGYKLHFEYNNNGDLIKETFEDLEDSRTVIQKQRAYKYDEKGRITEFIYEAFYTITFNKETFEYGNNGNITEKILYQGNSFSGPFTKIGRVKYSYEFE